MKSELFQNELKTIQSDDIRDFAKVVLDDAPDYFSRLRRVLQVNITRHMRWVMEVLCGTRKQY